MGRYGGKHVHEALEEFAGRKLMYISNKQIEEFLRKMGIAPVSREFAELKGVFAARDLLRRIFDE